MFVIGIILGVLFLTFHTSNACVKRDGICCLNFFRKGNICQECPAGTYGVNCSGKCVSGYYGRFCLEPCYCASELCDKVHGCPKNNTRVSSTTDTSIPLTPERCRNGMNCGEKCNCSDGSCALGCFQGLYDSTQSTSTYTRVKPLPTVNTKWQKIFFTMMAFTFMILVAAGLLYYKSSARKKKRSQAGCLQERDFQAVSEEHYDQTGLSVRISPRTKTDSDRNIYADIRCSQMMESPSNLLSKRNNLSIQKEKEELDLTIRNDEDYSNNLASHSCGRSKKDAILKDDKQDNDYGIFEESCEYSVLSLRRNIDPSEIECYAMNQSLRRQFSHNNDDPYCLTNVWFSEDHPSLDDCGSDSDVSFVSNPSENASQKSNGTQTQDET